MKFGLSDAQLRQVQAILSKYPAITEAVVFGSRAMGNYREASDVDIALKGNVAASIVGDIKYTLEEDTYLPFFFDIIAYGIIDNSKLKEHIDKYGVALYRAGWKECKLSEVASLVKDTCVPKPGDHLPYIGLEHIQEQGLRLLSVGNSDSVTSQKFCFKPNDVLFGKLRPYFRKVVKPDFAGVCSTDIWVVRAKEGNDQDFVFYFFANQEFVDIANSGDSGTRMPRADWNFLKDTAWQFPPLPVQRAIAAVLSSLDDKINLLHRQNNTLEGMAEAVYTHFFIDNRKVSWKECPLNELAYHQKISIHPNKNPASLFYHYSIPAFDEAHMPIPELGTLIQSNKYAVTNNTILFSKLNPHKDKRVWLISSLIDANSICSTEFQVMKPKGDKYLFFLYGFISHPENYNEIAAGVGGTSGSHQRIDPAVIFAFNCFLPDDATLTEYNETIEPIFTKIHHNRRSIQTLVQQRDSLLPKLISGEVHVKV